MGGTHRQGWGKVGELKSVLRQWGGKGWQGVGVGIQLFPFSALCPELRTENHLAEKRAFGIVEERGWWGSPKVPGSGPTLPDTTVF